MVGRARRRQDHDVVLAPLSSDGQPLRNAASDRSRPGIAAPFSPNLRPVELPRRQRHPFWNTGREHRPLSTTSRFGRGVGQALRLSEVAVRCAERGDGFRCGTIRRPTSRQSRRRWTLLGRRRRVQCGSRRSCETEHAARPHRRETIYGQLVGQSRRRPRFGGPPERVARSSRH